MILDASMKIRVEFLANIVGNLQSRLLEFSSNVMLCATENYSSIEKQFMDLSQTLKAPDTSLEALGN